MNSQDDRGWPEVERREQAERRDPGPPTHVSVDSLSNGARKVAVRLIWAIVLFSFTAGGWLARQEFVNRRQDERIDHIQAANGVIDRALSDATKELAANIREVVEDQQNLRLEIEENRKGLGILDAEKEAIRRDYEREHGRRP